MRKEIFLKRKSEALNKCDNNLEVEKSSQVEVFQCDHCDHTFKTNKGLRAHVGKAHRDNIPQLDGQAEVFTPGEATEEDTRKEKVEEKETQTDVFIKTDEQGNLIEPFLDLLYDEPPPTVYHPKWGKGEYHSTEDCKDSKANADRKAHCYRFDDGKLYEV